MLSPYERCHVEGVAALIGLHRGDVAAARRLLAAADSHAEHLGGLVVGYLWLARALDHERSGAPGDALAVLLVDDGDLEEIEVLLADAARLVSRRS